MTKIIIAGIGGVGGYFGGLLAKQYFGDKNVTIDFFARGKHLEEIKKNGLKVIKSEVEFVAIPNLATDKPTDLGIADLIIVSTKSYDLEAVIQQLKPCINQDTIILPLLNGVDSQERIKSIFPHNFILNGCVYIVSRLKQYGVVENSGNIQKLYFGFDNISNDRLRLFEKMFKEAKVETTLSENISTEIWEKFIFLSPIATITSYYDKCIGAVLEDKTAYQTLICLIEEVKQIAKAKHIMISDDITEQTLIKLKSLPFETITSMHTDFKNNNNNTELESLTGFIVEEGGKYKIDTPKYKKVYSELKKIYN